MIGPNQLSTYAQYGEDLVLRALLNDQEKGFYIDVGANDPDQDSVTKLFYEMGWHGINIEPIQKQYELFKVMRPNDITIRAGLGDKKGTLLFREYTDVSGHSTFSKNYINEESKELAFVEYEVEILTLQDIFAKYAAKKQVDFLKIDVEGLEYEVIIGNDWEHYRPRVICIESNHQEKGKNWEDILKKADYRKFIFDGLNAYFIAKEHWALTDGYAEKIIRLRYDALNEHHKQSWLKDSADLELLQEENIQLQKRLAQYREKLDETSLWDQPLRKRAKLAAKGLTVDWLEYKKQQKRKN